MPHTVAIVPFFFQVVAYRCGSSCIVFYSNSVIFTILFIEKLDLIFHFKKKNQNSQKLNLEYFLATTVRIEVRGSEVGEYIVGKRDKAGG